MSEEKKKYQVGHEPLACKPRKGQNPVIGTPEQTSETPQVVDLAPEYTGKLTMLLPTWHERLGMLAAFGVAPEDVNGLDKPQRRDLIVHLSNYLPKYVAAVAIVRVVDGFALTEWDDILHEAGLSASVVPEMSMWLLGKHNIGNPSEPS